MAHNLNSVLHIVIVQFRFFVLWSTGEKQILSVTVSKDQAGSTDRGRPIPFKFSAFSLYQITLRSLVFLIK